jgi:hypothetical protein
MSSEVLKELGASTSEMIQKAASVLEEEVAAGMVAAQEVERYAREDGEFPAEEFNEIMERLRTDVHEFVSIVSKQVNEFRSRDYDDLAVRFEKDAHGAADVILNLMNLAPELVDRMLKTEEPG